MSELKVSTIKNKAGTGAPDLSGGFTIGGQTLDSAYGFTLYGGLIDSVGTPDSASTSRGKFWWNDSDQTLAIYNDGAWLVISG